MSLIKKYYRHFKGIAFVRDILTLQAGSFVYMGATFVASILVARTLGTTDYGIYAIALAFTGTAATFLNLGQGSSLLVFFAQEYSKKSVSGMSAVLRNFLHVSGFNMAMFLVLIALTPFFTDVFGWRGDVALYCILLFLFDAVDAWNSMVIILLQAVREIRSKVLLEQSANLTSLALSTTAVLMGYGVKGLIVSQLIVGLAFLPISIVVLARVGKKHGFPTLRHVAAVRIRETVPYLGQGVLFALDKNLGGLFPSGLFFLLSLVAQPATVGIAKIAVQLAAFPRMVLLPQVGDLSVSVLANLQAKGMQSLRSGVAKIIKHTMALYALIVFCAMIAVVPVITYLYGDKYLPAIPLTLCLMLLSLPSALSVANSPLLRLYRKIHFSILAISCIWIVMIAVLFGVSPLFGPLVAFAVAYGIANALPSLLTGYLFQVVLREGRPAKV